MAQLVKHLTSARVMVSQSVNSSPVSGSVLTPQSLELASDSVSPSLSAPLPLELCLSLSRPRPQINKHLKKLLKKKHYIKKTDEGRLGVSVRHPTLDFS